MKSLLVLLALGGVAAAEPCPQMGLMMEPVRPQAEVTADGGIVVMEIPRMVERVTDPSWNGWTVKAAKSSTPDPITVAPGLYVVKPPANATSYQLLVRGAKRASATVTSKAPPALAAPSIKQATSGATTSRHVSRFVKVDLATPAPKGAIALVIVDAKGVPLSWGLTGDAATEVLVYSTQGGCVSQFPNGTVVAQPGDKITAFWLDSAGRKSAASTPTTVVKP